MSAESVEIAPGMKVPADDEAEFWSSPSSLLAEVKGRVADPQGLQAPLPKAIAPRLAVQVTDDTDAPDVEVVDDDDPRVVVRVCAQVEGEVLMHSAELLRGEGDPMRGYDLLTQERVGFGLAVLAGRFDVGGEDWALARHVLAVSAATRSWVLETLRDADQSGYTRRAITEGRAGRAAERDDPVWVRTWKRVLVLLGEHGHLHEYEISQKISEPQRLRLESALTYLEDEVGSIKHTAAGYRLTDVRDE